MSDAPLSPPVQREGLVRALGVRALATNMVNLTIGSGIFVLPAVVAAQLGPAAVLAYVVCAVAMGLVMACFAEAGSRVARSGGAYAYTETAFGPYVGFIVGVLLWFCFGVLAHAAVANALAGTLASAVPSLSGRPAQIAVMALITGGLALLNVRGVKEGARFAQVATLVKLVPLVVLMVAGLPAIDGANLAWAGAPDAGRVASMALVLFFAFGGSESALSSSGEIREPARTIPRAIVLAMLVVLVFYLVLQTVAQGVLGAALATAGATPLADAAGRVLGGPGRTLLLVGAGLSMFGLLGGDLLSNPRALFAQARDGFFFAPLARAHPRFHTPHVAIATYGGLAFVLAATGAFEKLAALASAGLMVIYLTVCLAVIVLRRRGVQEAGPPFLLPGGLTIPLLGAAVIGWLLVHTPAPQFRDLAIILAVASAAFFFRRKGRVEEGQRGREEERKHAGPDGLA